MNRPVPRTGSAARAFAEQQHDADLLALQIHEAVASLKGFAPTDWGFAGSMAHVNELLAEAARITAQLAAARPAPEGAAR